MRWWKRKTKTVLMPVQRNTGDPDHRTEDVALSVSSAVVSLKAVVAQLEQTLVINQYLEERKNV